MIIGYQSHTKTTGLHAVSGTGVLHCSPTLNLDNTSEAQPSVPELTRENTNLVMGFAIGKIRALHQWYHAARGTLRTSRAIGQAAEYGRVMVHSLIKAKYLATNHQSYRGFLTSNRITKKKWA